ncbi:hypothetical protein HMPREF0970_01422 [Schaalia odontolytica F0309]|nr:hypothetical protein HMPREF0970_01422 [Schaalia odontolytica F0309]
MYHRDWCLIPSGSSPRGRGKHEEPLIPAALLRLIPARAGKTPAQPIDHRRCRAHPRSREENVT